ISLTKYSLQRRFAEIDWRSWPKWTRQGAVTLVFAWLMAWAGYRFSSQPLDQVFEKPVHDIEVAHLSAPVRWAALRVVEWNPRIPAPDLIKGIAGNFKIGKRGYPSYLLGRIQHGGRWYFYPVVLSLKTPLALLLLGTAGAVFAWRTARNPDGWMIAVVPLSAL